MLWYKSWRETRWRFLVGMLIMCGLCAAVVLTQPLVAHMRFDLPNVSERLNEEVREMMSVMATYRGYVWSQWFGKNLVSTWALFAVLIGTGGVVTETARGSALFTLSLPVTRARLLTVRALAGLLELAALSYVPSLLVPLLSPANGESYPVGEALLYSSLNFVGGLVFYGFALLLSAVFTDQLKPIVIGVTATFALSLLPVLHGVFDEYNIYGVMSGRSYFEGGRLPWGGLAASLALSGAMFLLALRITARRDF